MPRIIIFASCHDSPIEHQLVAKHLRQWQDEGFRHFCEEYEEGESLEARYLGMQEEVSYNRLIQHLEEKGHLQAGEVDRERKSFAPDQAMFELFGALRKSSMQYHAIDRRMRLIRCNIDKYSSLTDIQREAIVRNIVRNETMARNIAATADQNTGDLIVVIGLAHTIELQQEMAFLGLQSRHEIFTFVLTSPFFTDLNHTIPSVIAYSMLGCHWIECDNLQLSEIFQAVMNRVKAGMPERYTKIRCNTPKRERAIQQQEAVFAGIEESFAAFEPERLVRRAGLIEHVLAYDKGRLWQYPASTRHPWQEQILDKRDGLKHHFQFSIFAKEERQEAEAFAHQLEQDGFNATVKPTKKSGSPSVIVDLAYPSLRGGMS